MLHIMIVLIRLLIELLLACAAVLSAMAGFYFLARQNAQLFGSDGVLLLLGLSAAAVFGVGSWKLLGNTLRLRANS